MCESGNIQSIRQDAQTFCKTSQNHLELLKIDEELDRLYFGCTVKDLSFFISLPTLVDKSWSLWSEDGKCQEMIGTILDSCDIKASTNITDILQQVDAEVGEPSNNSEDETESNSDDDCDDYYYDDDEDAVAEEPCTQESKECEDSLVSSRCSSDMAVKRLTSDLKAFQRESSKFGITGGPKEDNIFHWEVKLVDIGSDSLLGKNLRHYAAQYKEEPVITLDVQFPENFPFSPPFLRVVKPRFKFLTGHVTSGGSICMEMLTTSGWRPSFDIESILVQVRSEILSDSKASLDPRRPNVAYTLREAKAAFLRMVEKYKWN